MSKSPHQHLSLLNGEQYIQLMFVSQELEAISFLAPSRSEIKNVNNTNPNPIIVIWKLGILINLKINIKPPMTVAYLMNRE